MSWLNIPSGSDFSLANLPFGIVSSSHDQNHRPAVRIGNHVLDLHAFEQGGGFSKAGSFKVDPSIFSTATLNSFAAQGRQFHKAVRQYLQHILAAETTHPELLKDNTELREKALLPLDQVHTHLPLHIGDYTDFYAGKNHAYNVGVLFRGPDNALQPNYCHLPVAYHGRASSVVNSGTTITRPRGQILTDPKAPTKIPKLMPSAKFDFELEMGMFICKPNDLGAPISIDDAEEYIFGYVLMNDWSARDIQAWEYVPLGPFTSKNVGTSISSWVVLADAFDEAKVPGQSNDVNYLPYLKQKQTATALDINLEIDLIASDGTKTTITQTNARELLWSWPQMIAHHTITGCNLRPGDLFGSGTISGPKPGTEGSLLEQTKSGIAKITLSNGQTRTFLEDGDELVIRGWFGEGSKRVGFGEVSGIVRGSPVLN